MRSVLSIMFLLAFCLTYGQKHLFTRFNHITTEDGLPQNAAQFFVQDKEGFMWIATGDGLCRYDGLNFKVFRNDENDSTSIADQTIGAMAEDNLGNLWLGTSSSGISVMNKKTFVCKQIRHSETDSSSLWSDNIRKIVVSKDGTIWIGTSHGLNYFDVKEKRIKRIVLSDKNSSSYNPDGNIIWSMLADGNNLWIGTYRGGGLYCMDIRTKKLKHYNHQPENPNSLPSGYIVNLAKDKDGKLWISTRGGLSVFDEASKTFTNYFHDPNNQNSISSNDLWGGLLVDSKNNVWIGTLTNGLNLFNREKNNFLRFNHDPNNRFSISNNEIQQIFEDRSGLIWVGTLNGINMIIPFQSSFSALLSVPGIENSLQGDQVRFLEVDAKGRIWIGISSEGVDIYDPKNETVRHLRSIPGDPNSLPSNAVRDIAFDENGIAYIVLHSAPALVSYDYDTGKIKHLGGYWGKSIHRDLNGKIWVGTSNGLGTLDSINIYTYGSEGKKNMINPNVIYISDCDKENIWVGAGSTIARFNTKRREFTYADIGYSSFCLVKDSKGRTWMGTNAGLFLFDSETLKIKKKYGLKNGFPNELISSITEDAKGNLWLGSNYGLICFNPENEKVQTFDMHDGIPNNEFNMGSLFYDGKIYIGTVGGLLYFNPETIKRNQHKPPVVITQISVLNKPYKLSDEELRTQSITFNHQQYFFTIEFSALDFANPEKNQYAYKLVGFNDDWIYIGNKHEVTFTNLDPGEYTLLVKASNNHGVWNEEGISMQIIILPPWWKTTWFRVTAILSIILIVFLVFKWRTAQLKKQKRMLEQTVKVRTAEVVHQKEIIEEKQKEIIDSINYAKRLQEAILTPKEEIDKHFNENFLLYLPKDIVAGDFYFFEATETHIFYAAADCTGHGVPGAMVSIVCSNALTRSVNEFNLTDPGKILDKTRELIVETFRKSSSDVKDGMDISLMVLNKKNKEVHWAGANNPLWIIRSEKITEIAADKQPIGKSYNEKPFTTHRLELQKEDMIILFTDGYADQFGGEKGKKFKYSNLQKLLVDLCKGKAGFIHKNLEKELIRWKGDLEQVDDVCIIGIKI